MAFTSTLLPLATASNGHYAASSADTSDSGGDTSVSGRSSRPGLRAVTLCRRLRHQPCLGFSLRGGREHGTGFFVSAVEKGSEAHLQGLMVGDQIVRVNGLPVEDATHREVLNLIQSQNSVTFKVRSVGMIPVKDSYSDALTWRLVEPEPGGAPEPPDLPASGFPNVHLYINVASKAKLGCGICKGPEWKPGIFVQFTKENSLARNAGLRPGDQIIQCNNVVFTPDTPFTEAVSVLRSNVVLELVIQRGAGVDLFPGESSGYNSSASSVAGDQSPDTWPATLLQPVVLFQAVSVLRSTGVLELVIQRGAGVDLFPGESSGYNSSASSVAGDQSPDTWPATLLQPVVLFQAVSVLRSTGVLELVIQRGAGLDLFPGESSGYNSSASSVAGDQSHDTWPATLLQPVVLFQAVSVLRSTGVLELVIQRGAGVDLFPGESSGYNSSASSVAGDQSPDTWPATLLQPVVLFQAVSVLRSTGVLELVIQRGAGVDLFPGESSGYNSSASSVAGDQSPDTWPHKRLSIVKEESVIDSDSRLTCSEPNRTGGERYKDSDRIAVPSSQHPAKPQTTDGACTVIRVGPDTETYQDNELNSCTKLAEICMVSQQLETKTTTVLVEVHQSEDEETVHNQSDSSLGQLTNSSSVSSFSSSGANSLCSAISQELQRRSEKRAKEVNGEVKPKVELHKCGMDKEKVEQHQQLMEEFRRAHKKMFAHTLNDENKTDTSRPCLLASQSKEERESFRLKRQQKQEQHAANMSQERVLVAVKERDLRLERDKQDMTEAERELTRLVRRQQSSIPPPPPLPLAGASLNSPSVVNNNLTPLNNHLPPLPPFPPDCPTPDYDKESLSSDTSLRNNMKVLTSTSHPVNGNNKNGSADFVEMQSLESFKLNNPAVLKPKPPQIYFQPNMNGSTSVSSASSKISSDSKPNITIREYPKNTDMKNPERFQFLSQNSSHHTTALSSDEPLATRLQDELSQTLSKANLRQDSLQDEKTLSTTVTGKNTVTISINAQPIPHKKQENINHQSSKQAPFYLHKNENSNNNNINSSREIPRKISTTVISQMYTNGNGVKHEDFNSKNCVSFNLNQPKDKPESRVVTVVQPNGILKNGLGGNVAQVQIHTLQAQKSPSKSIKFAGITTAEVQEPKK